MPSKTEQNLALAFAAESKAAARNSAFAQKAAHEGYGQIAALFRAVSEAEAVHARRYLMLLRGKVGSTEENLEAAFQSEIKANVEEYPKLIQDAAGEENESALTAFSQASMLHIRNGSHVPGPGRGEPPRRALQARHERHALRKGDGLLCLPGLRLRGRGLGSG